MRVFAAPLAVLAAVVVAAPAGAAPDCGDIAPNTRLCTRSPGHTAIIATPDPALTNPFPGWGFGDLAYGFAAPRGGGIWIGS